VRPCSPSASRAPGPAAQPPRPSGLELIGDRDPLYGGRPRADALAFLVGPLGRVLDLGCGEGVNAAILWSLGATHLAGVELDPGFAEAARDRYDEVVTASVPEGLTWPAESFDTVLCYDLLEHLYDPWHTLRRVRPLLRPGGRLHISIPNARNRDVWLPLIARGSFDYQPAGVMDVTHIRFFTRRDAVAMVDATGFEVLSVDHAPPGSRKRRLGCALTANRAMDFLAHQWYLLARPRPERP